LSIVGGRKVAADMQILAGDRTVHLIARADNLSDFGPGAVTPFLVNAEVPGQSTAGNIHAEGSLGLGADLAGTDLRVHIDAPVKSPWQTLMQSAGRDLAAIKLDFALHSKAGAGSVEISQLAFALGDLRVTGQATVHTGQTPLRIEGQLRTDYLDWAQATLDAGFPQPPAKPPGAMFQDAQLAWPLLQRVKGFTADVGLQSGVLKLRAGLPLQNVKMQMQLQTDQMRVPLFSADFLGGATTADALFTAHNRQVKLNLKASNVSIEQWRSVLHKPFLLSGGPLGVNASVSASGASLNQLAATMTGPVSLRMGPAVVRSSSAGATESLLTGLVPVLAGKRADHMDVVCLVASMPFENGRATATSIAGARTESSQLLTDGVVDMRDQTLDLHGRVTSVNGLRLGASILTGDVNVSGKLVKPRFHLDARGMLGTAARVGAAIASIGLTAVGQTVLDANAADACKVAAQRAQAKSPASGELAAPRAR
ncbi:MAG TPA: AsmA-like C-terminal region-containing protein, partial [Herbaspirillum sp.]|nr:AsmA-like C-terminal region-containing protein [Herbaspirillum sp.]